MKRFWNNLHQVRSKSKDWRSNVFVSKKTPFLVGSMLFIFLVFCVVLLCVITFWVLCCDASYDFRIKTNGVFLLTKTFDLQSFDFERTWWRLFQKHFVCLKSSFFLSVIPPGWMNNPDSLPFPGIIGVSLRSEFCVVMPVTISA
jgi:hypothetical protein